MKMKIKQIKIMKASIFLTIAMLFLVNLSIHSQWSKIGFDGKTVSCVSSNQTTGNIYAVVETRLFKTADNGLNWVSLNNGLSGLSILKVEVDIDGKIYVGTNSGIYTSWDNGTSFQSLNGNLPNDFGLYPAVSSVCCLNNSLYIGTSAGVYTSKKDAINWKLFNQNLPLEQANRIMVFFNNYLYIAMNSGIYKTQIDTDNWIQCYSGRTHDIDICGNDLYAGGIIKSSDFGDTWGGCTPGFDCRSSSILGFGSTIWIGSTSYGGKYSTDFGKTWLDVDLGYWKSITNFSRRGTSVLVGTEYLPYEQGSGGLFIKSNVFANIKEVLPFPEFKTAPGLYDSIVNVKITIPDSSKVYYTEDGTLPTIQSKVYSSAIVVNSSKIIKTIAINSRAEQSKVNTGLFNLKTIIDSKSNEKTLLYPNPGSTIINIESDSIIPYQFTSIFNSLGIMVKSGSVEKDIRKTSINIEDMSSGIYFLKLESDNKYEFKKFIKK